MPYKGVLNSSYDLFCVLDLLLVALVPAVVSGAIIATGRIAELSTPGRDMPDGRCPLQSIVSGAL